MENNRESESCGASGMNTDAAGDSDNARTGVESNSDEGCLSTYPPIININSVSTVVDDATDDFSKHSTIPSEVARIQIADDESHVNHEFQGRTDALPLELMLEISKLKNKHGNFTYYVLRNEKLILHAERQDDKVLDDLKKKITKILETHLPPDAVIAIPESCKASLCGSGIGELVAVGVHCQTMGLFLKYKGKAYFATAGHRLPTAENERDKELVKIFPERDLPGVVARSLTESIGVIFDCFSYNPLPNASGHLVLHHVDIMICEVPLLVYDWRSPHLMNEVRDRCKTCLTHSCEHHRDLVYVAKKIMYFNPERPFTQLDGATTFVVYSAEDLIKTKLMCYPYRQEVVVGEVVACKNEFAINLNECLTNVLVIKPLGREAPASGDSGSVWVKKESGEAVAITCGMAEVHDYGHTISVWLAALLHPCLDALCEKYKKRFESSKDFKVLA